MSDDLEDLKRGELDELAADAGVPDPSKLPNKKAVIDALSEPNPALIPDPPPEPAEKSYRVTGVQPVLGYAPGSVFTALIPQEQEGLLLVGGHITETKES